MSSKKLPETPNAERILVERANGIGRITFNNPARHNAMNQSMWERMGEAAADLDADKDVRVIVLTGAGERSFVSGADISEFAEHRESDAGVKGFDRAVDKSLKALGAVAKPTIARIDGYCIGGGLAVALACDIRVCTDFSTFGIPAAKLGIGYVFDDIRKLYQLVGPSYTAEILYTGRQFTSEEARYMGLANQVLPRDGLDAHMEDLLGRIAANAPLSIAAVKRTVIELNRREDAQNKAACDAMVAACIASNDIEEGRAAFMEKRPANFTGT
jgi:enoyl-CoA hydratase